MDENKTRRKIHRRTVLETGGIILGVISSTGCTGLFQDDERTDRSSPTSEVTPSATLTPMATPTGTPTSTPTGDPVVDPTTTDTNTPTTTPTSTPTPTPTTPPESNQTRLSANDGSEDENFGVSAAAADDGTTTLVGAPGIDVAGSVYVFDSGDGEWAQSARITPLDGDNGDDFGQSVALADNGTTALVGALGVSEDEGGVSDNVGAAYIFARSDGTWGREARLEAGDGTSDDMFGRAVALTDDGTTALIGAPGDAGPTEEDVGAAYIFTRSGGSWPEEAKLVGDDGDDDDRFGSSVAVAGDDPTALVGALFDEDPNGNEAGSAYVFEPNDGEWTQQAKLAASDGDFNETFGRSVALASDGNTALIGAPMHEIDRKRAAGAAYIFERDGQSWVEQIKLVAGDADFDDRFGRSVALSADGTTALAGAFGDEDPRGERAGSAYIFEQSGETWSEEMKLVADDGDERDRFGDAVGVGRDGAITVIGALGDEDSDEGTTGSAYGFSL